MKEKSAKFTKHYCDVIMAWWRLKPPASRLFSQPSIQAHKEKKDQRNLQSSASLAFVWGIHRLPVNSRHKWPVTRKMFPFDDVIMKSARAFNEAGNSYWRHAMESQSTSQAFCEAPVNVKLLCVLWFCYEEAVKQVHELPVISNGMML